MPGPGQIPLPFPEPSLSFDEMTITAANRAAIAAVRRTEHWPYHVFCLVGAKKSGLSTIARAWVHERGGQFLEPGKSSELEYCIDQRAGVMVAVDRADEVVVEADLLQLMSAIERYEGRLLLTAREVPVQWPVESPDLISRLKAAPVTALLVPDEALMRARLKRACARTYLILSEPVEDYLVTRLGLNYAGIEAAIAVLDSAAAGRPLSVPLAKEALIAHDELRAQVHGDLPNE